MFWCPQSVGGGSSCEGLGLAVVGWHEHGLVGEHDCLHLVSEVEPHKYARDVGLQSRVGDEEVCGDLDGGEGGVRPATASITLNAHLLATQYAVTRPRPRDPLCASKQAGGDAPQPGLPRSGSVSREAW